VFISFFIALKAKTSGKQVEFYQAKLE